MTPYYTDDSVTLHHGDCLDVLRELPDASVDAVVTDPPYGIGFMGKEWDQPGRYGSERKNGGTPGLHRRVGKYDHQRTNLRAGAMEAGRYDFTANGKFQQWCKAWAAECLRILKPGGHLVAFGGSRTWHRLAGGVEDAGFEIRDSITWLYGSGFPKSLDVSKAIDKAAGAEREVIGPGINHAAKVKHGGTWTGGVYAQDPYTGAQGPVVTAPATEDAARWQGWGTALKPAFEPIVVARKPLTGTVAANVLEHGTGALNIDACRIGGEVRTFGGQERERQTSQSIGAFSGERAEVTVAGRWPTNVLLTHSPMCEVCECGERGPHPVTDDCRIELDCVTGCPILALDQQTGTTTSRIGRPRAAAAGHGWGMTATGTEYDDTGGPSRFFPAFRYEAKAPTSERPRDGDTAHPTVKPLDLMRWLVRLVTPTGGVVLDPFAGSGTTAEACVTEGFRCIAIEREADYLPLIVQRLAKPIQLGLDFDGGAA
jgi:DNA modification methylase